MRILAIGGAHPDRRGRVTGAFAPGASNPGTMREEVGGGAFNALRAAVGRGATGALCSVRGGDAAGERVAGAIAAAGIADLSVVFLDRATPTYTALLDSNGELVAGLADMALYDLAFAKQMRRAKMREAVAAADAILVDANLPEAALAAVCRLASQGGPVFAIAVSPAKVVRLAAVLPSLACLFMNRREAAALAGAGDLRPAELATALAARGLRAGVITDGGNAVTGFDRAGSFALPPPAPRAVADVTGAGDALAGATVAAMLQGVPFMAAVRHGVAAALLAVETSAAVPDLAGKPFEAALALTPQAEPLAAERATA